MSRLHSATLSIAFVLLAGCGNASKEVASEPPGKQEESLQAKPEAPSPSPTPSPDPTQNPTQEAAPTPPPMPAAPAQKLSANSRCAAICTRSTALGCPAAKSCEAMCKDSLMGGDACKAELEIVTECLVAQPVANWECTDDGVAAIKDGFCEAEQAGYAECIVRESGG